MAAPKPIPIFTTEQQGLFWARVDKHAPLGCWRWAGTLSLGYGTFRGFRAHRISWELLRGTIPHGLTIDHLCRNKSCVNPDHLEPVSSVENVMRGIGFPAINARKTHCKRGHLLVAGNLRIAENQRQCRACALVQERSRRRLRTPEQRQREIEVERIRRERKGRMTLLGPTHSVSGVENIRGCLYRVMLSCGHQFTRECIPARIPKRAHCKQCRSSAEERS